RTNRYYFGDYYDAAYVRRGYTPWVDYRVRGNVGDPLLTYYRWQHRNDNRWETNLRTVYQTRREDPKVRPPRTVALQEKVITDPKLRVAAPLDQLKVTGIKLEPVPKA